MTRAHLDRTIGRGERTLDDIIADLEDDATRIPELRRRLASWGCNDFMDQPSEQAKLDEPDE